MYDDFMKLEFYDFVKGSFFYLFIFDIFMGIGMVIVFEGNIMLDSESNCIGL